MSSPTIRFVRSIPGQYMTLAEVAREIDVPEDTLRTWRRNEPHRFGPSRMTYFGSLPIYLYDLNDVERTRAEAAIQRADPQAHGGNVTIWTVVEGQDRQRRLVRARYWEAKVARLAGKRDAGSREQRDAARAKAKAIRRGLALEAATRRRERRK